MSAAATRRHSTRPVLALVPRPNPRVFPIRFAPTAGLGGLLRKPHNSYGWVGTGSVLLDQHSLRITAKRLTVLGLRRTVDFVHQSEIGGVYREGNAVRIDLLDETRPGYFYFWAEDAGAASDIVGRLPTNSTVELEGAARGAAEEPRPGLSRPPLLWAAVLVVLIVGSMWAGSGLLQPTRSTQVSSRVSTAPQLSPMPIRVAPAPAQPEVADPGSIADLENFLGRFDALEQQFALASEALQLGKISQQEFSDGLQQWLMPQWKMLSEQLAGPADPASLVRANTDAQLQLVVDSWRRALNLYVYGLRDQSSPEVLQAFQSIGEAEKNEWQSRALLQQFERQRDSATGH